MERVGVVEGTGSIHHACFDYYGKRAAVASSDHSIRVWDLADGHNRPAGELKSHEGPVWKVTWAHPRFGYLLASCSYDMRIIFWKETQPGQWQIAHMDQNHVASVNDVEFAPCELGLRLACASSDSTVSVLTYSPSQGAWQRAAFTAHGNGAQCLSWAPYQLTKDGLPSVRIVTGGCDFRVVVWTLENDMWSQECALSHSDQHTNWIRDVSWRPSCSGPACIASGGWDKKILVWSQEAQNQSWSIAAKFQASAKVESLCWSITGSLLAAMTEEDETLLFREGSSGFEAVPTDIPEGVKSANPTAAFVTSEGTFVAELYEDKMPLTVSNFIDLAQTGFYNNLTFHRVIKNFMLQFGCPFSQDPWSHRAGTGLPTAGSSFKLPNGETVTRGPQGHIPDEFTHQITNDVGTLSMANTGTPNSGGCQMFINTAHNTSLDWWDQSTPSQHPVFGKVFQGMDIVSKIEGCHTDASDKPNQPITMMSIKITR